MRAVDIPSSARKSGWKLWGMVSPNIAMNVAPQMPRKTSRFLLSIRFACLLIRIRGTGVWIKRFPNLGRLNTEPHGL